MLSLNDTVEQYSSRLMDIRWFMRLFNENIAIKAIKEDHVRDDSGKDALSHKRSLMKLHLPLVWPMLI